MSEIGMFSLFTKPFANIMNIVTVPSCFESAHYSKLFLSIYIDRFHMTSAIIANSSGRVNINMKIKELHFLKPCHFIRCPAI